MPDLAKLKIYQHRSEKGLQKTCLIPIKNINRHGRQRHAIISSYKCMSGYKEGSDKKIIEYFIKNGIIGIEYVKDELSLYYGVLELFAIFHSHEAMVLYVLGNDKYLESIHT